jgi:hypothetical protein
VGIITLDFFGGFDSEKRLSATVANTCNKLCVKMPWRLLFARKVLELTQREFEDAIGASWHTCKQSKISICLFHIVTLLP